MRSVMENQQRFAHIEANSISRSSFDRSFGHKTTINAGKLYPLFIEEALPGDTFTIEPTIFGRMATLMNPIMDNIFVDIHFFSVPYRLVWDNFKRFMGETENPQDTTDFIIPQMKAPEQGYQEESIYDYLSLPTKVPELEHMSLPLRAYNLIWNTWYRDQNLQQSVTVKKDDLNDDPNLYQLLPRGKRKDYFTSALPFAQKGQPVSLPLATRAPVYSHADGKNIWQTTKPDLTIQYNLVEAKNTGEVIFPPDFLTPVNGGDFSLASKDGYDPDISGIPGALPPYAELSEATAVTINQMRQAITMQQFLELDARGGTRYIETVKSHFDVTSPDARLQYPEFLGERTVQLNISPIAQQSASQDGTTPLGNLGAIGTFSTSSGEYVKTFTEHEIVIGIVSIRADLNYQQGLNKMWSRKTKYDFYWPTFAHLGEQAILNKEIFAQGTEEDEEVFGYQERYAEYRYKPSQITGLYRSNADQSLDLWHLAQDFPSLPSLNSTFIQENPPISRVIATPEEPQFLLDCYFDFKAARPMPVYSTPGLRVI